MLNSCFAAASPTSTGSPIWPWERAEQVGFGVVAGKKVDGVMWGLVRPLRVGEGSLLSPVVNVLVRGGAADQR